MPDGFDQGGVAPARPETVLVIEANELQARQVKTELRAPHRQVFTVPTAREALAALIDTSTDLIVASMSLPDLSGVALLETLRDRAPGIPVLALSEDDSLATGVAATRAGAVNVLTTPLSSAPIRDQANKALIAGRGARDLERARDQVRDRDGTRAIKDPGRSRA